MSRWPEVDIGLTASSNITQVWCGIIQGCTNPRQLNLMRWNLQCFGAQYGICFESRFWRLTVLENLCTPGSNCPFFLIKHILLTFIQKLFKRHKNNSYRVSVTENSQQVFCITKLDRKGTRKTAEYLEGWLPSVHL